MEIKPIRNDQDHAGAVREIDRLWGALEGTPESDKLDVLSTLVDAYEKQRWPVEPPDPIATIKDALEERNMSQADLGQILGSRQRAHEILTRKRALSNEMICALHQALHIPAEILIQPYELARSRPRPTRSSHRRSRKRTPTAA